MAKTGKVKPRDAPQLGLSKGQRKRRARIDSRTAVLSKIRATRSAIARETSVKTFGKGLGDVQALSDAINLVAAEQKSISIESAISDMQKVLNRTTLSLSALEKQIRDGEAEFNSLLANPEFVQCPYSYAYKVVQAYASQYSSNVDILNDLKSEATGKIR